MNLIKTFDSFNEGIAEIEKLVEFDETLGFDSSSESILERSLDANGSRSEFTEVSVISSGLKCFFDGLISYPDGIITADSVLPAVKKYNSSTHQLSVLVKLNDMVSISWSKIIGDETKYKIMFSIAKNVVLARKYPSVIALTEAGWIEHSNPLLIV